MDNGNVLALDFVDNDLANVGFLDQVAVPQEKEIASLKGRLHGTTKNNDDRAGRIGNHGKTLPHLPLGLARASLGRAAVHTMKAVERISAKLSSCEAAWRGFPRLDNMFSGGSDKRVRAVLLVVSSVVVDGLGS